MAEFYELNKQSGRVIVPANSLAVAVATEDNIHFSFRTGLKQEIPTKETLIERDIIEKFDIAVSCNEAERQEILHSVLRSTYKITDIVEIAKSIDKTAQVRYDNLPVLKFKDGAGAIIPFAGIGGINKRSADSFTIEMQDGKSYVFLTDALQDKPKFKDINDFMDAIVKRATARLDTEIDLAEYGIIALG